MPIVIKSDEEIAIMREAGRHVAQVLQMLVEHVRPGVVERELDELVRREFARRGVIPTFLGYQGYPATVCISVNDEIVHGIPGDRAFQEGDIVSIDLGCTYRGFVADCAVTVGVGRISPEAERLIRVTEEALWRGIRAARAGSRLGAIGHAIQTYVEAEGFSVVREYVGHGVGRQMHEDPQVPNYGPPDWGPVLRKGMVLAIEPMVNMGTWRTKRDPDGWTVRTADGSLSAHFEHTIAITDGDPVVLTLP
ncbi:MAG: type I methionyl aminopeptidase [Dehalococcoidia bacterium]|nr:type I methionyl aminopeptidase [Dehalococcoidia bacterium]MDW8008252.1 type I methionyl aminopeptidase [Chloroflexota bacterium]